MQFPSQDLTNQYISTSYQNVVQNYVSGNTGYFLDGYGNVILRFPTSSLSGSILTQDQTASVSVSSSYSNISSLALVADVALLADTASISVESISASHAHFADTASYSYTSSYETNIIISSSHSDTASYVLNAVSSSTSLSSSVSTVSGGGLYYFLVVTGSGNQPDYIDTTDLVYNQATGQTIFTSVSASSVTASLSGTASFAKSSSNAQSASFITGSNVVGTVSSASYVKNAVSASYVLNAVSSSWSTVQLPDITDVVGTGVGINTSTPRGKLDYNNTTIYTIGDPTTISPLLFFNYGSGAYGAYGNYYQFNVYAYWDSPSGRVYSTNPLVFSGYDDSSTNAYYMTAGWSPVANASGYRIVVGEDDQYGAYGDNYIDTTLTHFSIGQVSLGYEDYSNQYYNYLSPMVITPTSITGGSELYFDTSDNLTILSNQTCNISNGMGAYMKFDDYGNAQFKASSGAQFTLAGTGTGFMADAYGSYMYLSNDGNFSVDSFSGFNGTMTVNKDLKVNGYIRIDQALVLASKLSIGYYQPGDYTYFNGYDYNLSTPVDLLFQGKNIKFNVNESTELLHLDVNGNMGVNNSTPSHTLDVVGDINFTTNLLKNGSAYIPTNAVSASYILGSNVSGTVASSSYAATASFTPNIKSGIIVNSSFGGSPLSASVSGLGYLNTNYSIFILGVDSRAWSYGSKTSSSFVINSNSSTALTGETSWTTIKN